MSRATTRHSRSRSPVTPCASSTSGHLLEPVDGLVQAPLHDLQRRRTRARDSPSRAGSTSGPKPVITPRACSLSSRACTVPRATPSRRATSTSPIRGCARSISSSRESSSSIIGHVADLRRGGRGGRHRGADGAARAGSAARRARRSRTARRWRRTPAGSRRASRARRPRAAGRRRAAELVEREHPAEDDAGLLGPEAARGERDRRRHGGDPVEPVEGDEQRPACSSASSSALESSTRLDAAQRVVPEQQHARVHAVGQPARSRSCRRCRGCPSPRASPAAVVAVIPWSCAAGMKCTAIRPTVVAPQTKKLAASAQNVPVRIASRSTATALWAASRRRGGSIGVPP